MKATKYNTNERKRMEHNSTYSVALMRTKNQTDMWTCTLRPSITHTAANELYVVYYTLPISQINWKKFQSISCALFTQEVPVGLAQTKASTVSLVRFCRESDCS